jgi:rhodanese-related sulfurtransferase
VSVTISATAMSADDQASLAQSAIDKAETSRQHAASVGGEWRDTGKMIKKAKAALKEKQFDKAIKLAKKADRQGGYGYEQAISQKTQKNLTMPAYLHGGGVSGSVVAGAGYITPSIKVVDVIHNGKPVTITRITDKKATIPTAFSHTARACPPFCIQPIIVAENVGTIGELEVLEYLKRGSHGDRSIMVVDSRTPEWVQLGTIPGSVSIPWNKISVDMQGTFAVESETEILDDILSKEFGVRITDDGKRDFRNAKTLVMFCNGNWCPQSSTNITTLIKLGYPAYKLKWYRGGMQSWVSVGLTTAKP